MAELMQQRQIQAIRPDVRKSDKMRLPAKTVKVRSHYPPEEPEWDGISYEAGLAVNQFYESGYANRNYSK